MLTRSTLRRFFYPAAALLLVGIPANGTAQDDVPPVPLPVPRPQKPYAPANTAPLTAPEERPLTAQLLSAALPIDLPTTLRLVNENSPTIGLARARLAEADARVDLARVVAVPDLIGGVSYYRLDGQTQNQRGDVFFVNRSNLYGFAGPRLQFGLAEALFLPLVANRLAEAAAANTTATVNQMEYEAASAFLDLQAVHAALAINADTLARAEQMLRYADAAEEAGLAKTPADADRARTEVALYRKERLDLTGQAGIASARLAQLLLLDPSVDLKPTTAEAVPVILVPGETTLETLTATAKTFHPEVIEARLELAAADTRLRQEKVSPLIPRFDVDYAIGGFGGGTNSNVGQFDSRSLFQATASWQLDGMGFGYAAQVRVRQAQVIQARYQVIETEARVATTASAAAKEAAAKFDGVSVAQQAVSEATEMYRKLRETSFNMVGPRPQYDALEPLLAIRALNQARREYLNAVIEFNRAQFRLYTALGRPPIQALDQGVVTSVEVPVAPASFDPPENR